MFGRSVTWTETISGMLRMQLTTEFLRNLERKRLLDTAAYTSIHTDANMAINDGVEDPFAKLLDWVEVAGVNRDAAIRELRLTVATTTPISYLHLGRPETILVDTPEHRARLTTLLSSEEARACLQTADVSDA